MWQIICSKLTRTHLILIGIVGIATIVIVGKCIISPAGAGVSDNTEETFIQEDEIEETSLDIKKYADIKGAVQKPGVYEITENMRLLDLILLAGGLTEEANNKVINQAMIVQDQADFYIPAIGEDVPENAVTSSQLGDTQKGASDKININSATAEELQQLDGVGAKKAAAIISYREEHGSFATIESLSEVSGIGSKTVDKLKDKLTL